jgi:hypothetical protein
MHHEYGEPSEELIRPSIVSTRESIENPSAVTHPVAPADESVGLNNVLHSRET